VSKCIRIYTDGSSRGNPGPGGYGIVLQALVDNNLTHQREISEAYRYTTNNRMELLAVIKALKLIKQEGWSIEVYSDSKYVVDAINKRWIAGWVRKGWKDVKNVDLWLQLIPLLEKWAPTFHWVKGHASNPMNNLCDKLATEAADSGPHFVDYEFERVR
jgi:ribonuclease HI